MTNTSLIEESVCDQCGQAIDHVRHSLRTLLFKYSSLSTSDYY